MLDGTRQYQSGNDPASGPYVPDMSEQPWPTLSATHGGRAYTAPPLARGPAAGPRRAGQRPPLPRRNIEDQANQRRGRGSRSRRPGAHRVLQQRPDGDPVVVGVGRRGYGWQRRRRRDERVLLVQLLDGERQHGHQLEDRARDELELLLHRRRPEGQARRVVWHDREDERRPADGQVHDQRGPEVVRRRADRRERPDPRVGRVL